MLQRHNIDLYNPRTGTFYDLTLSFDDSDGGQEVQRLRKNIAQNDVVCPLDLRSGPLADTLRRKTTKVVLMYAHARSTAEKLPDNLRGIIFGDKKRKRDANAVVGMYAFDVNTPNVLEYICLRTGAKFHKLGMFLYEHYELNIRLSTTATTLYLSSVNRENVMAFYFKLGFSRVKHKKNVTVFNGENGAKVKLYDDTVLMSKTVRSVMKDSGRASPIAAVANTTKGFEDDYDSINDTDMIVV